MKWSKENIVEVEEAEMEEESEIVQQKTTVKHKSMTQRVTNAAKNGNMDKKKINLKKNK